MTTTHGRRDRTGEPIDPADDAAAELCPRRCWSGWLNDPDEAERPRPCPHCRPHPCVQRRSRGQGSTPAGRAAARRIWDARHEQRGGTA